MLHLHTNYKTQNNILQHEMSILCLFQVSLLSPGSNIPSHMSWRATPWFQLRETVLMHVHILNVCTVRSQDIYFPGSQYQRRDPMPHLHAQPLPTFHVLNTQAYRTGFICHYIHCAPIPESQQNKFSEGLQGRGKAATKGVCIKPTRFKNPNYLALPFPRSNQLFASTPCRSYSHCNFWIEALGHAPTQYFRFFSKSKVTTILIPAGYSHTAKAISGDAFLICHVTSHSSSGTESLCSDSPSSTTAAVPNKLPGAFLIQSSNRETSHSTCIPPSHTDLNELLGVLVKIGRAHV